MPRVSSVQPAAVEVYWKYRLESIQSIRRGMRLTKPNMDSDSILEGIQNEGLIDVRFIPAAERIDLYYKSLNEAGRGPVVDIVATTDEFLLNNAVEKRTTDLYLRGAGVLGLRAGNILRVEDEFVVAESLVLLDGTQLYEGITAFWYLNEVDGDRNNVYDNDVLKNFTANLVLSQDGPQAGTTAAYFTGSLTNPQALSAKYNEELSLGDTDSGDGFTFSCWVRLSDDSVNRVIISRNGRVGSGRREFQIQYNSSLDRFEALMIKSNLNVDTVYTLTHSLNVAESTWYFICCWFDPAVNRLYMSVNDATENIIIPVTGAIPHASIPTTIGARLAEESNSSANLIVRNPWNGRIANVGFWKRILTGAERASLFRDYTLDSIPAAHVILEDRGAHGTEAVAHDVDAVITKMFVTVPHNSIIMDAQSDQGIPDAPESFFCAPSGDDAEIGVAVVVAPPLNNRKTLKRLQIQAKTDPIFPSDIEHTTGSKNILSGPHVGEVTQGGNELITSIDLSGVAPPHHLYTYETIDVDVGSVTSAYAYTIETVEAIAGTTDWRIQINEKFVASRGVFGNSRDVNFLVVRGWLDAPRDYVVNDAPLVTPPAGDLNSHEPFQQFYKTTQEIYLRARYVNRAGAGPWIYWDGVNGSVDKSLAVLFSPAGIQIPVDLGGMPNAPLVAALSQGGSDGDFLFLIGVAFVDDVHIKSVRKAQLQVTKSSDSLFADPVHYLELSRPPVQVTLSVATAGKYLFRSRVWNEPADLWSDWSNSISRNTETGQQDSGLPGPVQDFFVEDNEEAAGNTARVYLREPEINSKSIWAYEIQAKKSPLWASTVENAIMVRGIQETGAAGTEEAGGHFLTDLTKNWTVNEWVGKILYLHGGIDADTGEVVLPHAYPIRGNTATRIDIGTTGSYTFPFDVNGTQQYLIADRWQKTPDDMVIREDRVVYADKALAGHNPDRQNFQWSFPISSPTFWRARAKNQAGFGQWFYYDGVAP